MQFTKRGLSALGYPKHDIRLLQSRQRGASGATTGFAYQRSFAVLRVLEVAAGRMDGSVFMDALCPVDDVVVESGGHHEHSQVKASAIATWGSSRGKLRREFLAQDDLMQKAGIRRYTLQIVTPHAHRVRHFRLLAPATLKGVLYVRRVARSRAAEGRPWTVPDVARALDALLIAPLGGVSQREQLWMAVNHACRTPWRRVRVQAVVEHAGRLVPTLPVRDPARKLAASRKVIAAALDVLNAIPRLDARIEDGICLIECAGVGRRFVARIDDDGFARFIRRILLKRPTNYRGVRAEMP